MQIKTIREKTGLTQRDFAAQYGIPLQTLKQWESDPGSSCYRVPPEYVVGMLARLVSEDYNVVIGQRRKREDNLIYAAKESKYNARHWLRYLRKEIEDGKAGLTPKQIEYLMDSAELTMYQKISLKRALTRGTPTHEYVAGLNKRAKTTMLDKVRTNAKK